MKPVSLLVLLAGVVSAVAGFNWLWNGLDIVQVERGWSAVIAGATLLSAGLVICALAGVIWRLDQVLARLARRGGDPVEPPVASEACTSAGRPVMPTRAAEPPSPPRARAKAMPIHEPPPDETAPSHEAPQPVLAETAPASRAVVGRHVSGDATYIMYADGSVEAQTSDGTVTFASLEALRAHTEDLEAAQARG